MGLWATITGAGKVADIIDTGLDIVKTGTKGLDKIVYTSEEQAIDGAKNIALNMDHALAFGKLAQGESGASAVTRRLFGLIILGNFTLCVVVGLILLCLDKTAIVENLITFVNAVQLGYLAIAVVVSTFGYYAATKGRK